jgi:hypothetical protein
MLERRINRLERAIKNETRTRKFEGFESDLDVDGARATANRIANQFCRMIGVSGATLDDLGHNVIESLMYGWLIVNDTDEIAEDPDARFAFQYSLDGEDYTIIVHPTDNSVNLINEDGYSIDPAGHPFSSDSADLVAYPLSKWKGFDLSMIDEEDDGYNVEAGDDFNDYYDESRKCSSKPTIVDRVARLEKILSRKSR